MSGQPDAVRENFAVQRDHGAVLVGVDLSAHFLAVGGCVIEHIIEEGARGQPDLDICQHIRVCPVAKAAPGNVVVPVLPQREPDAVHCLVVGVVLGAPDLQGVGIASRSP